MKSQATTNDKTETEETKSGKRKISDDSNEAEKQVKKFRLYARMVVGAFDALYRMLSDEPLSDSEKSEGEFAWSALMFEYLPELGAAFLVGAWVLTTGVPRTIKWWQKRREAATQLLTPEAKLKAQLMANQPPKKEVIHEVPAPTAAQIAQHVG